MTRRVSAASIAVCFLMLSACGGGGASDGVGSTPPPPVAQENANLNELRVSQTFGGRIIANKYIVTRTNESVARDGGTSDNPVSVRYDAGQRSYTVTPSASSSSFGPGDVDAASSTSVIAAYQKKSGSLTQNLALFKTGPGNPALVLTYLSYGAYQSINDRGATLELDNSFFTYGIKTAIADIPRTGAATYQTNLDGQFAGSGNLYALSGRSSFEANFAQSTFMLSMSPIGTDVLDGATRSFGTIVINGSLASAYTTGEFSASSTPVTISTPFAANFLGSFYGPAASEFGGTFSLFGGSQGTGNGVIVGRKN